MTGRPFGGRNDRPDDEVAGERSDDRELHAPTDRDSEDERASRAPEDGSIEDADVHDLQPSQEAGATLGAPVTEAEVEGETDH